MNNSIEDSWFDLAAELGVETPKPVPRVEPEPLPVEEPPPVDLVATLFDAPLPDAADPETDTEIIEAGGDTEADRKRKRRRRRKKRSDGTAPDAGGEDSDIPAAEEPITQPRELLRDIIRNWDVPGWDDIIAGLHRPHR